MPFTWESIYSLFSPPATRSSSPNGTPSLSFADFSKSNGQAGAKQTDLPMPPNSAFGAAAGPAPPSPAESSASAASERDFLAPNSPYSHHQPSLSTTSTATTATTASSIPDQQHQLLPHHHERSHTTPAPAPSASPQDERPPAPRRSATYIVAPELMSREFPKPAHEPTLDEMLARQPCKRSLHHYVKNYREKPALPSERAPQTEDEAAERARRFEETKRRLVEDRERLAGLVVRR